MCHHEVAHFGELKHSLLLFRAFPCQGCQNLICAGERWEPGGEESNLSFHGRGIRSGSLGEYIREDNKGDGEHPGGSPEDNAHFSSAEEF